MSSAVSVVIAKRSPTTSSDMLANTNATMSVSHGRRLLATTSVDTTDCIAIVQSTDFSVFV